MSVPGCTAVWPLCRRGSSSQPATRDTVVHPRRTESSNTTKCKFQTSHDVNVINADMWTKSLKWTCVQSSQNVFIRETFLNNQCVQVYLFIYRAIWRVIPVGHVYNSQPYREKSEEMRKGCLQILVHGWIVIEKWLGREIIKKWRSKMKIIDTLNLLKNFEMKMCG